MLMGFEKAANDLFPKNTKNESLPACKKGVDDPEYPARSNCHTPHYFRIHTYLQPTLSINQHFISFHLTTHVYYRSIGSTTVTTMHSTLLNHVKILLSSTLQQHKPRVFFMGRQRVILH